MMFNPYLEQYFFTIQSYFKCTCVNIMADNIKKNSKGRDSKTVYGNQEEEEGVGLLDSILIGVYTFLYVFCFGFCVFWCSTFQFSIKNATFAIDFSFVVTFHK